MARNTSHFKLGIFIFLGLAILVTAIILLGSAELFKETIPAETYFNESVQGLDIGAPVKFRGVPVGSVSRIDLIINKYQTTDTSARYVLVEIEMDKQVTERFAQQRDANLRENLNLIIKNGLRVRLTTQGLTGVAFLELNFFDPIRNPPLRISWDPEIIYIPSAPSTMSRIEAAIEAIGSVMQQLKTAHFDELVDTIDRFFKNMNESLEEADVEDLGELIAQNLSEFRDLLARVNVLLANPKSETLITDLSDSMSSVSYILNNSEDNMVETFSELRAVAVKLRNTMDTVDMLLSNPKLKESADVIPETLENVQQASSQIRRAAVQLERLLTTLNDVASGESDNIEALIEDLAVLVDNLNALTGDARHNPARLFFGEPPQRIEPENLQ